MSLTAPEIRSMGRSEVARIEIDWGENTSGSETGCLKAGDTLTSCTVTVDTKPTGASDPTFGSVTVNGTPVINERTCSAGEASSVQVTMGSSQTYGIYLLKFVGVTTNGYTLPRFVRVNVIPGTPV